jgi:hypothetical protein
MLPAYQVYAAAVVMIVGVQVWECKPASLGVQVCKSGSASPQVWECKCASLGRASPTSDSHTAELQHSQPVHLLACRYMAASSCGVTRISYSPTPDQPTRLLTAAMAVVNLDMQLGLMQWYRSRDCLCSVACFLQRMVQPRRCQQISYLPALSPCSIHPQCPPASLLSLSFQHFHTLHHLACAWHHSAIAPWHTPPFRSISRVLSCWSFVFSCLIGSVTSA